MSEFTCEDYHCEGSWDHNHIGVQSHLRRVIDHGVLIDGKTRLPIEIAKDVVKPVMEKDKK